MKRICCFLAFLCGICVTYAGRADDWYSKYDMFRRSCELKYGAGNTEALHCTVGGQPIADWGDTFNVGLRRY